MLRSKSWRGRSNSRSRRRSASPAACLLQLLRLFFQLVAQRRHVLRDAPLGLPRRVVVSALQLAGQPAVRLLFQLALPQGQIRRESLPQRLFDVGAQRLGERDLRVTAGAGDELVGHATSMGGGRDRVGHGSPG